MTDLFYMQIICLGLLVLAAHFGGKIARKIHMGEVAGQVLGGLVVGPILLFIIEHEFPAYGNALETLHFFTFIFLSIIAFGIGDELLLSKLKKTGRDAFIICITQAFATWLILTATFLFLGFKTINAFIIGSIGIATAPAVTFVIMNKLDIVGRMRNMLGGIVVLDDVIEIIVFSIVCQIAILMKNGKKLTLSKFIFPITKEFFFAILLGVGIFIALRIMVEKKWLNPKQSKHGEVILGPEFLSRLISEMPGPSIEILILVAGTVCLGVGIALHFHLPFLITAIVGGVLVSNLYSEHVFDSLRIENATSMYTLMFFALIGANAKLDSFHIGSIAYVGAYVIGRSVGKIGGTWLGCKLTGQDKRFTQCLPKLMLPQAGVAAVEAYYVATVLGKEGEEILSIILPGLVIFEVIGVLTSERALLKWRSWATGGGELIGEEEIVKESLEHSLNLETYIKHENIRVPFNIHSKGEAIWELIRTHQSVGHIDNAGEILEIILQREKQGGTALGDGVVILHGRLKNIKIPAVVLGIIPEENEIVFGGEEDDPVKIIFLVLSPIDNPNIHLKLLASLAHFLSDAKARDKLVHAKNEYEVMEVIRAFKT